MSLLRDRAIAVSFESTRRARRPADARDLFVSDTSSRSEAELNVFALQPRAGLGATRSPTAVTANATRIRATKRRGSRSRCWLAGAKVIRCISRAVAGGESGVVQTVRAGSG